MQKVEKWVQKVGIECRKFKLDRVYIIYNYYMALSHKDWELTNAWIWLAEMDIHRGLDFPI